MKTFNLSSPWRQIHHAACSLVVAIVLLSFPAAVLAQEPEARGYLGDVTKRLFLDPTTYAPAVIFFPSQYLDWASSQPFFKNGYMERNYDFTVTGRSNDVPVSFGAGNRKIVRNTMINLSTSVVHNLAENMFERQLIEKYPEHRKVIRTLGWVERIAVSGYLAYSTSAPHYRQWRENERLARQLGYR
jgi:hypothetical protein